MKNSLFLGTVLTTLLIAGAASADVVKYKADLSGDQEDPTPVVTDATALGTFVFDTTTKKFCGKIDYVATGGTATDSATPLSSALVGAHIHEATASTNSGAPFILMCTDAASCATKTTPIAVSATLTDEQATALTGGKLYANLHTSNHTDGEIRGDVVPQDQTDTLDDVSACLTGGATDGGTDGGNGTTPPPSTTPPGETTPPGATTGDAGTTPTTSSSDGGCSTTGPAPASGIAIALGVGVAIASMKRRKKK